MSKPASESKKAPNPNATIIDARAATYDGGAIRIMAVTDVRSGIILLKKQDEWREQPVAAANTIVVTDTPAVFNHWGLAFDENQQMGAVMAAYKAAQAANLLKLDDSLRRFDPATVIQTRKVDERGKALDFDSMGINNGHIAILLAVWAAGMTRGGYVITETQKTDQDADGDEFDMMPFSI